jgi:predicted tellurium resistance membrane protein TerC
MSLMNRFPVIIVLGVGLLGYTSGEMILSDGAIERQMEAAHPAWHYAIPLALAVFVIAAGTWMKKKQKEQQIQVKLAGRQ